MGNNTFDESKLERMKECTNAQEVLSLLAEDGFELTDTQLDAIAGGTAAGWSLEELISSFDETLDKLFPEGFDPKVVWSFTPSFIGH